jgi:DUF3014 family protein
MDDLPDYELQTPPGESPQHPASATPFNGLWIAAALLIAAAGAATYVAFVWRPHHTPATATIRTPAAPARQAPLSLGGKAEPMTLPPLDASDALVRTLVGALSQSPVITAWLTTNGLIRNFTVVTENIADGATPAKHLAVLRPSSSFGVVERNRSLYVDPRSYDRYTAIADAIASVDATAAANLYATLKPRIEEANRDLGFPDQSFDRTLERAIVVMLDTPIPADSLRLRPKGIGYAYEDDRLESLTSAQKQFLRMGPRNMRAIKLKLREVAVALGIPPVRLPAP